MSTHRGHLPVKYDIYSNYIVEIPYFAAVHGKQFKSYILMNINEIGLINHISI